MDVGSTSPGWVVPFGLDAAAMIIIMWLPTRTVTLRIQTCTGKRKKKKEEKYTSIKTIRKVKMALRGQIPFFFSV